MNWHFSNRNWQFPVLASSSPGFQVLWKTEKCANFTLVHIVNHSEPYHKLIGLFMNYIIMHLTRCTRVDLYISLGKRVTSLIGSQSDHKALPLNWATDNHFSNKIYRIKKAQVTNCAINLFLSFNTFCTPKSIVKSAR